MKRLSTVELVLSEPTFPISDINLAPSVLHIFAQVTYLKKKKKEERLQSCTNLYDPAKIILMKLYFIKYMLMLIIYTL